MRIILFLLMICAASLCYLKTFAQENVILEPNQEIQDTPSQNQGENKPDTLKEQTSKVTVDMLLREKNSLERRLKKMELANARLEKTVKQLYISEQDFKQIKKNRDSLAAALEALNKEKTGLKAEISVLKKENDIIRESSRQEKAELLLKIASSYIQAKFYSQAIDAYLAALSMNPNDAKPHYYLGLLYQQTFNNSRKALVHFRKYLELTPYAEDRKEVEYLIELLKGK